MFAMIPAAAGIRGEVLHLRVTHAHVLQTRVSELRECVCLSLGGGGHVIDEHTERLFRLNHVQELSYPVIVSTHKLECGDIRLLLIVGELVFHEDTVMPLFCCSKPTLGFCWTRL